MGWQLMDWNLFNEHFNGRAFAFMKTLMTCRRTFFEKNSSVMLSCANDSASFTCRFSFSNLVGEICRSVIFDQPAEHQREGSGSKLRDGNFDLFP